MNEEEKDSQKQQSESKQSGGRMTQWWRRRDSGTKGLIIIGFLIFVFLAWPSYDDIDEDTDARDTSRTTKENDVIDEAGGDDDLSREEVSATSPSIGSTVEFNDWELTLQEVQTHSTIGDETARGQFLVLMIEATNEGSTERALSGGSRGGWRFVDIDADRSYEYDSGVSLEHYHTFRTDTWHREDIGPGLSATVPIVFDIPDDVAWGLASMTSRNGVSTPFFVELD